MTSGGAGQERNRLNGGVLALAVAIWTLALLWLAVASGPQHDYCSYLEQWKLVLSGANPWATDNAYGPLHNALAPLTAFGPLGPKLVIAAAFLIANICLVRELYKSGGLRAVCGIYLLAIPANVLIVSVAIVYGINDALVAAFVIFALLARRSERLVLSGAMLGLAVLLKYYPAVLVPAFAFGLGRIGLRLIASAVIVTLIGCAVGFTIWGADVFTALAYGSSREPKLMSLLAALGAYPNLIGGPDIVAALIKTNSLFVIAATALAVFAAWRLKVSWLESSVICVLVMFAAYKVGHQQFFVTWLALVAALPLLNTESSKRLAWICLPFVLFLSAYQWGYAYGSDNYRETLGNVRSAGGFVAFGLAAMTIAASFAIYRPGAQNRMGQKSKARKIPRDTDRRSSRGRVRF